MALFTCSALSYTFSESFCLPVDVEEETDKFTVERDWIIGAVFLGLILGVALVLLLAKPFLNAWEKKKLQDEERLLGATTKSDYIEGKLVERPTDKKETASKVKKGLFRSSRFGQKKKGLEDVKEKGPDVISKPDIDSSRGMLEILLQTANGSAEIEMALQDMAAIVAMEKSIENEKNVIFLHILSILVKRKVEKKETTQRFYSNFIQNTEADLKDLNRRIQRVKEEAEEKLRNDPKLSKETESLETEMQKLQTDYNYKQAQLQIEFKDKTRLDLLRSSGMSEVEVNDLMARLMNEVALAEEKLGVEQFRQRRALEQRLARRRQAVEYSEVEDMEANSSNDQRIRVFDDILAAHMKDSSRLEGQRDDISSALLTHVDEIKKYYAKECYKLGLEKSDSIQSLRSSSFYRLEKDQEKEKAEFLQQTSKKINVRDFVKLYHDMVTRHHMEREALEGELDQKELQEMLTLRQEITNDESAAIDRAVREEIEKLENATHLTKSEAEKIIRLYKAQTADILAKRQRERQAALVQLQEKLKQRLAAAEDSESRDRKEQEMLKQEQMAAVARVLSTNMELSDEAKERVLRENEQNMQALSNRLLLSKLRQQKSLEIKLNQRKSHLAGLKRQQRAHKSSPGREKADSELKLAEEIAVAEDVFEQARQEAVAELRRQLARETEETLKLQDSQIGFLIGRLQVGQARREAVLGKQDVALKELQARLENGLLLEKELPNSKTNQIIEEHYKHVAHLNRQMQRRREVQQGAIVEKLQSKKANLEEQIETQLQRDAQEEYTERQRKGAGYASLALMQTFLEQKHTKAMVDLEAEMLAELEKSKNDLNIQLQRELVQDLESKSEDFLQKIAAISRFSKEELRRAASEDLAH